MPVTISVIVPARNAAAHLPRCLDALSNSLYPPVQTIVVDDGSQDDTRAIAESFGVITLGTPRRNGPAFARNLGTTKATGDIFFFVDSDVAIKADTLAKIAQSFDEDPELDALIGSYDTDPYSPDFISQYRNLMHSFVHQTGAQQASTFWSGCGAIRSSVFKQHSGFAEDYLAIEDIELGYRLIRSGCKIMLDRSLLVTHLKKWTFIGLVKTDILDRGIPWTELILRDRFMPNDLNLQLSQRVSVALVFILILLSLAVTILNGVFVMLPLFACVFLMLARWWGEIGSYKRPRQAVSILSLTIFAMCVVAYRHQMWGLLGPLIITPLLLVLRHRYNQRGQLTPLHRWYGIFFICTSVYIAAYYLPSHHLITAAIAVVVLLAILNSQFYIFLAGKRGIAFMLCAIPFHLLYHFYNGISFITGLTRHLWMGNQPADRQPDLPDAHPPQAEAPELEAPNSPVKPAR